MAAGDGLRDSIDRFPVGQEFGGEPLSLAYALDLECRGLDDLLDPRQSLSDLGISSRTHRVLLGAAFSHVIGAVEVRRVDTDAGEQTGHRDRCTEINSHPSIPPVR